MSHLILLIISFITSTFALNSQAEETSLATFAGGCFWCMEKPFNDLDGVSSTISGYTDGHVKKPYL